MADNAQGQNWPQDAGASTYSVPAAPRNPYLEQLKGSLSADAYKKLMGALQYGGESDIGAQIFTPLSKDVIKDVPKTVQPTYDTTESGDQVAQGQSVHVGETNGIPVYANYDEKGQLTGFSGDQTKRAWVNGNQSYGGQWDASGNANPQQYNSKGGGFFGNLASDIGGGLSDLYMAVRDPLEAAAVVGGNYFLPGSGLLTSRLVSDKAKENLNSDLGRVAMIGSGIAGGVNGNMSNYGKVGEALGLTGGVNPAFDGVGQSGFDLPPNYTLPSPVYDYGSEAWDMPPPDTPPSIDPDQSLKDAYGPAAPETSVQPEAPSAGPEAVDNTYNPAAPPVPPPASPSLLDKALDFASANPLLTAGGVAALIGASGAVGGNKTDTSGTGAGAGSSTPQTYTMNPYDFQRTYNTPTDTLGAQYTQGQNTGERNWMTDQLTKLASKEVPAKASGGLMDLHHNAQHLAHQGRGGDDTLVHMGHDEVAGLQALARAHGKTLTRNPRTGMPEAFNLGQELGNATKGIGAPIIGAGLSYFTGMDPVTAAALVGGTQGIASGSLEKGLMAGLGAYGGASLVGGLSSMGSGQIAKTAGVGLSGDAASDAVAGKLAETTPFEKLSTGASYAADNPKSALASLGGGSMWKGAGVLGAAAAPFIADKMVQTTVPTADALNRNPEMIRPYSFNRQQMYPQNAAHPPMAQGQMPPQQPPMVQGSYQPGQSTAERKWFEDTLTPLTPYDARYPYSPPKNMADGGMAEGGYNLGGYSDGGRLLRGPGDGVSDSIPAVIGHKQPARLADGEFVVPARIVSELGNGSTEAGARKLYAMMDRVQKARAKTIGKDKIARNSKSDKYLPE